MISANEMKRKIQFNQEMIKRIIEESTQDINNIVNECKDMLDRDIIITLEEQSNFIKNANREFDKLCSKNSNTDPNITLGFTLYVNQLCKVVVESKLSTILRKTAKLYNYTQDINITTYEIYNTICKRVFQEYSSTSSDLCDSENKPTSRLLETLYNFSSIKKIKNLGYIVKISYDFIQHKVNISISC
jgi:hypothetical protein